MFDFINHQKWMLCPLRCLLAICLFSHAALADPASRNLSAKFSTEQYDEVVQCSDTSIWEEQHKHLHIEFINAMPTVFEKISPWYGPDGKRYMKILEPDTTKKGPWTLQVFVPRPGNSSLLITVTDFADAGDAYWESLSRIIIPVFWGHIAETEFTIDVDAGTVFIAKDFNYGQVTMPKEEACPKQ